MRDRIRKALEFIRRLKYVPMEKKDREKWMREWRKRTIDQILKEGTVWGCRDVALVMKHIIGDDARIVEGVRILKPGGHIWVQVSGKNYDSSGQFNPILSEHGPYVAAEFWEDEKDPVSDWEEWKRRYAPVKLSFECAAIAYAAFQDNWRFIHTVRTTYWVKRISKKPEAVIAAWLHDIGYVEDPKRHAEIGAVWAKRWLEERELDRESINLVVDGILNHRTDAKPKTEVGHAVRLANALATVDPVVIAAVPEEELPNFKKHIEKKRKVIQEYQEGAENAGGGI